MKRLVMSVATAALLLSSCGGAQGTGMFVGANMGGMLGSAVGGLFGGMNGSNIGTIIGVAGGAAAGSAIAKNKADRAQQRPFDSSYEGVDGLYSNFNGSDVALSSDNSLSSNLVNASYSNNDDRIYPFGSAQVAQPQDYNTTQTVTVGQLERKAQPQNERTRDIVELRNPRFQDDNNDNILVRNEMAKVTFEIFNNGTEPLYNVDPIVEETTGNKHVYISPTLSVQRIDPGKGIRYTALITTDKWLKNGNITLKVYARQGARTLTAIQEFNIPTRKK
ncbi:hypothetical protein [Hoylesella nanceiensis]|uniref:hypothetical protein n=1 Tax=Hoylesella nanceiensis TaxID=425941 RepID=UPI001CB660E8|nr:hypothetical protein [Hoylesella nanceiensis]MBF1420595.1 hypothetical protein [Hoylesella nanceiensis]